MVGSDVHRQDAKRFRISLPADAAYLGTARVFAGSVARHAGCPEEAIEDMRLGVSEICAESMPSPEERRPAGPVIVTIVARDGRLWVQAPEGAGHLPRDRDEAEPVLAPSLAGDVLRSLFDDAESVTLDDGNAVVRFSTRI